MKRKMTIAIVTVFVLALMAVPAFAQTPPPTLALDPDTVQTGLFTGANIILIALGSIMFMLIGIGFGKKIFDSIGSAIQKAF